jgi:hypothetical protein
MKTISISIFVSSLIWVAATNANPAQEGKDETVVSPTRFLAQGVGVDQRIEKLKQRLAINKRERGPFGLNQIPSKTPVDSGPLKDTLRKAPFHEFINEIQISVINAKEKEFLVGARMFRLGQVFPIARGKERLSVEIQSVSQSRVAFKNLQTGEIAVRRMDGLPNGITASVRSLNVPGVTPNGRGERATLYLKDNTLPHTP